MLLSHDVGPELDESSLLSAVAVGEVHEEAAHTRVATDRREVAETWGVSRETFHPKPFLGLVATIVEAF